MDSRKYPPLPAGHFSIGEPCGVCTRPIEAGDETTLVPIEHPPRDGRAHTVEAALCHWACVAEALRLARATEVT
jgi:hypothetical protein